MGGRPPATEPGIGPQVGQPLRGGLVQHGGEDAVLARQLPDRGPLRVADPVHHELGEPAGVVGYAERGVPRPQQLPGGGDDRLQHLAHRLVARDRQYRRAQPLQPILHDYHRSYR
jgi:hypothetical protein